MSPKRPALRWHGGKWMLAPWIIAHFPAHRCYVEPFGGAMSVLLRKKRSYSEVYNDLDSEVVNLFRVLRSDRAAELREKLALTPFAREEFAESYEPSDDPVEAARRLTIRCFMGFGSNAHGRTTGFRSNSFRSGTTPAHDWVNYAQVMPLLIERVQAVVIENKDAKEIMAQHDNAEVLHYVDPPYVMASRADTAKDYAHEMTDGDHRALAELLHSLKGMVVLSGYHSELYDELFKDWHFIEKSALADGAKKRVEVLWFNPLAWERQPQGTLT